MPRTIEVALASDKTDRLLEKLREVDDVVGLRLQRGVSLNPPGDVITVQATNDGCRAVLSLLGDLRILDGGSVLTSEARSLISPPYQNGIDRESNETIWDEMAFLLRRETNISGNYLSLMVLAGAIAAVGLWTNTLHIVIGAMVIAPGFEPLLRIPFGLIGGPRPLTSQGVISTLAGYLLMALGAALMLLALRAVEPGAPVSLEDRSWVRYWSSVQPTSMLLSLVAAAAGAVTVAAQRSVLSAGVMIALALVPAMSIVGMALASGDLALAGQGLIRWSVDGVSILVVGGIVLGLKQRFIHRRQALG